MNVWVWFIYLTSVKVLSHGILLEIESVSFSLIDSWPTLSNESGSAAAVHWAERLFSVIHYSSCTQKICSFECIVGEPAMTFLKFKLCYVLAVSQQGPVPYRCQTTGKTSRAKTKTKPKQTNIFCKLWCRQVTNIVVPGDSVSTECFVSFIAQ